MAKGKNHKAKLDNDVIEQPQDLVAPTSDDDDREANEDLSLKIVKKSILKRCKKRSRKSNAVLFNDSKETSMFDICTLEPEVVVVAAAASTGSGEGKKSKRVKRSKKKKVIEVDSEKASMLDLSTLEPEVVVAAATTAATVNGEGKNSKRVKKCKKKKEIVPEAEEEAETITKVDSDEKAVPLELLDHNAVETSDNTVLRKLLRGPRYFDPDSAWETCYNCGEEGHMAINCPTATKWKKDKACYVCGSLDHGAKQCSKPQNCFICSKSGHRAKDCPDKQKSGSRSSNICLRCGASGHDMFTCKLEYSLDDLKDIQCYVCKSYGHLCCVDLVDTSPRILSCYKCGQLGHTGLACGRASWDSVEYAPSSCYKCGEGGHIARECTSSTKVWSGRNSAGNEYSPTLCYKCGEGGHFARDHTSSTKIYGKRQRESTGLDSPSSCYKCGEGGHFSRDCTSTKIRRRDLNFSTPHKAFSEINIHNGFRSSPGNMKRKKHHYEERDFTTPKRSNHTGHWIKEDPEDFSGRKTKSNRWKSPLTSSNKHYDSPSFNYDHGYSSSSKMNSHYRPSRFERYGNDD